MRSNKALLLFSITRNIRMDIIIEPVNLFLSNNKRNKREYSQSHGERSKNDVELTGENHRPWFDRCVSVPRVSQSTRTHVLLSFQGVYSNRECTRPRFSDHFQCCGSSSSNRRRLSLHPASKNRTAAERALPLLSSILSFWSEMPEKGNIYT